MGCETPLGGGALPAVGGAPPGGQQADPYPVNFLYQSFMNSTMTGAGSLLATSARVVIPIHRDGVKRTAWATKPAMSRWGAKRLKGSMVLVCVVLAYCSTLWEQLRAPIAVTLEILCWPPSEQGTVTRVRPEAVSLWGQFVQGLEQAFQDFMTFFH